MCCLIRLFVTFFVHTTPQTIDDCERKPPGIYRETFGQLDRVKITSHITKWVFPISGEKGIRPKMKIVGHHCTSIIHCNIQACQLLQ